MRTALLISNMSWSGMGQTNRQAWAFALSQSEEFDRVVYLENVGWRPRPQFRMRPISGTRISVVHSWNLLPWAGRPELKLPRLINALLTLVLVRVILRGSRVDLLVTFDPLSATLSRRVRAEKKIYDCLDLYSEQPQYAQRPRAKLLVGECETELCREVDLISVSSPGLHERFQTRFPKPVVYVPGAPMPPEGLESSTWPPRHDDLAVYVGALDSYKVDYRLFEAIRRYGYRVQLIGRLEHPTSAAAAALDELIQDEGIDLAPPVQREMLLKSLASASVGLIAMSASEYSDHSFPLKYWDYLWAGVPVLAVHCRSLTDMDVGVVHVRDADELSDALVKEAVLRGHDRDVLRSFAAAHSATKRIATILESTEPR